jgi:tetratricopeptide (TPR) repeat protein
MQRLVHLVLAISFVLMAISLPARADDLRNLRRGEPMPAYKLPTIDEGIVDGEALKGSVVVIVYLSAEQRSSELAAMDSANVLRELSAEPVKLVYVTADVVHKPYFQRFRQDRGLSAPLAFDADRSLYARLGLIVFPTTIVVNAEGKLAHVISLHRADYARMLDGYIRHVLGHLNDQELQEQLRPRNASDGSPKSLAASHRAVARFLREKGRLEDARTELVKAREQDPENPDILLELAELELKDGNIQAADALIAGVLASRPEHRWARQLKGISLFRQGDLDAAEAMLKESLVLNPDPELVHYYLGQIYERRGDHAKALEHYREALRKFLKEPAVEAPK